MFNLLHAGTYLYCGERVAVGAAGRQPAHADRDTNDRMEIVLRATGFLGVARVFGRTSIRPYSYALIITCLICYMPGRIFIAGSA